MRKTLPALLSAVVLLASPSVAYCQNSGSNDAEINVNAYRFLFVNDSGIINISDFTNKFYVPMNEVKVKRGRLEVPFTAEIKRQYDFYLAHPEIAGIVWGSGKAQSIWVNSQMIKDYEKAHQPFQTGTIENGILYQTITDK